MTSRARALPTAVRVVALAAVAASVPLGVALVPVTAAAASDVVVDDFAGTTLGVRTEILTGSDAGGPPRASFQRTVDGWTLTTTGSAAPAGIELDYAFDPTDLTAHGADSRVVVALRVVDRTPHGVGDPVAVTLSVTDGDHRTGTYAGTLPASGPATLSVDFHCGAVSAACLAPAVDPSRVTGLRLTVTDRGGTDPATRTTVGLESIRTAPADTQPVPSQALTPIAAPSTQEPAVSASPTRGSPIRSVPTPSSAPPTDQNTGSSGSTPSPSAMPTNTATVEPRPGSPTARTRPSAPVFTSPDRANLSVSQQGSFTVTTSSGAGTSITAQGLPLGLRLTDNGDGTAAITGTPAFDGTTAVRLVAIAAGGTATQVLSIQVRSLPTFTNDSTATFVRGAPGSFDLMTTGVPTPQITLDTGELPAGLTLTDNHDGTATIAGTPTAAAGSTSIGVTAASVVDSTDFTLSVVIEDVPAFTSAGTVRFAAHSANGFTVTTSGVPAPNIVVDQPLPDWLAFDDYGDGTGVLRTVSSVPAGSFATVALRAMNSVGADATQVIRVSVD